MKEKRVLVLCTGNSCRSVMSEAIINSLEGFEAHSAGSAPVGWVHPHALSTIKRNGLPTHDNEGNPLYTSKSWDSFAKERFDTILTVCDNAANEVCPVMPGEQNRVHWSIPDPASAKGSPEEVDAAFEAVYALLKGRIMEEFC